MTSSPPHCTLSGLFALLQLLQWHKSIRFFQAYGRHTSCHSDGSKGCIGKDSEPNRRLLKELTLPHYASMHPKAVADDLKDVLKNEPCAYKAEQPHHEGTTPGA